MSTLTVLQPPPTVDDIEEPVHVVCCDPDTALCGVPADDSDTDDEVTCRDCLLAEETNQPCTVKGCVWWRRLRAVNASKVPAFVTYCLCSGTLAVVGGGWLATATGAGWLGVLGVAGLAAVFGWAADRVVLWLDRVVDIAAVALAVPLVLGWALIRNLGRRRG